MRTECRGLRDGDLVLRNLNAEGGDENAEGGMPLSHLMILRSLIAAF